MNKFDELTRADTAPPGSKPATCSTARTSGHFFLGVLLVLLLASPCLTQAAAPTIRNALTNGRTLTITVDNFPPNLHSVQYLVIFNGGAIPSTPLAPLAKQITATLPPNVAPGTYDLEIWPPSGTVSLIPLATADLTIGAAGPPGPPGPPGPAGADGAVGPQGAQGVTGPQGPQGPSGATGPAGPQGPMGPSGPAGVAGANGLDGRTLLNGTVPPTTGAGADGDFYLDTVANIIYGPKSGGAWPTGIPLVGPQGAPGPAGPVGPTGPPGLPGATGSQGPTGATGPAGPQGPMGPTGPAGADGANGVDGKTLLNGTVPPTTAAGADGDFYIDTAANQIYGPKSGGAWPTGIPLLGPQGAAGPAGPVGPTGAQGVAGATGLQGPQGPSGATGPAGPQGPIGPAGPSGQAGANGVDGKTVLSGPIPPDPNDGADGDFYIDTTANRIYGPKMPAPAPSGVWRDGVSLIGPKGTDGNTVFNGTTPPDPNTGVAGDFYIDTTANKMYGPKIRTLGGNGLWPANGVSLVGPQGVAGDPGPVGATGPQGPPGPAGPQGPPALNPLQVALLKWSANTVTAFPVGDAPQGVAFDGANIWVANYTGNNVTKLRASDGEQLATYGFGPTIGPGAGPCGVAFDGANIWVTLSNASYVVKMRASDGQVLGTYFTGTFQYIPSGPTAIAFDGANLWVANFLDGSVAEISATYGTVRGPFPVGANPIGLAFDGTSIWVGRRTSGDIIQLDRDGVIVNTFSTGQPRGGPIVFDGDNVWMIHDSLNYVTKMARDGSVLGTFDTYGSPTSIGFDAANIWVGNSDNGYGTYAKFRASDGSFLDFINIGAGPPNGMAFDGTHVWATDQTGNLVRKL